MKFLKISIVLIVFTSCRNKPSYTPNNLKKATNEVVINKTLNDEIDINEVVFKNQEGEIISKDAVINISNDGLWITDSYLNKEGEIVEMVLRKSTPEDLAFLDEIREANKKLNEQKLEVKLIPIDCDSVNSILEEIYYKDQKNRGRINKELDRDNLVKVVSIIEKCDMPSIPSVTKKQMTAIWLVFQHADNYNRKKYLPYLEKSAMKGDLSLSNIALMKDRTLVFDGKEQIYGTQMYKNEKGDWVLCKIKDSINVDKRRESVGLEPLNVYLKQMSTHKIH